MPFSWQYVAVCVVLAAAFAPGNCASGGRLPPPLRSSSLVNPEVHWIRKTAEAPLPAILTAPLPTQSSILGAQQWSNKTPARAKKAATAGANAAKSGIQVAEFGKGHTELARATAQQHGPPAESGLTLAELEQTALANNPTLVQAAMRVQAAQGKCLQAGLYPNPTIGYIGDEMGADGTGGQQGAFFSQEIVTANKLGLRSAVAAHEIVQAEHALQAQQQRVLGDVRRAWYEALAAQKIVALNEQLVRIGAQGVGAAGELLAAMEVSRVDLLQARIEADSAKLQLADAQNRYLAAWRRLAAVAGVPELQPAHLAGDLAADSAELTWQESLAKLLAESPELAEAHAGVQRARSAVARENAQWIPNIDVQASARYHHPDEKAVATVEVGLPLPIFNRNQGNICEAQAQLIAAEREIQRIELELQDRLAAAFEKYTNARGQAKQYAAEILPNAKRSLDLVQAGYRNGEHDYLTLLTAQRTYFRVNLAYLESLLEYRSNRVSIEGFLLSGGLRGVTNDER